MSRPARVLVDASAVIRPVFHRAGSASVDPFAEELEAIGRHFGVRAELAVDAPAPTWRHEAFPAYKAGRPPAPEGWPEFLDRCLRWAVGDGYRAWWAPRHEADDVLATIAAAATGPLAIVSGDKDLLQVCRQDQLHPVRVFWRGEERRPLAVLEVTANLVAPLLALAGDQGDGVPGLPGVGPVRAREALLQAEGDLDEVVARAKAHLGPKALRRALSETGAEDRLRLCLDLVTLRRDAPIAPWPADGACEGMTDARDSVPAPAPRAYDDCDGVSDGSTATWAGPWPAQVVSTAPHPEYPSVPMCRVDVRCRARGGRPLRIPDAAVFLDDDSPTPARGDAITVWRDPQSRVFRLHQQTEGSR